MKLIPISLLFILIAAMSFAIRTNTASVTASVPPTAPPSPNFILVAHSGAGDISKAPPEFVESRRAGMVVAIKKGYAILAAGGTSLDAVESTIRSMEDAGLYDSGRGAYYTRDAIPEMAAAVMDGKTLAAGSVAALQHIANPIHLARLVIGAAARIEQAGVFH